MTKPMDELLRSMPELKPMAGAWQRVQERERLSRKTSAKRLWSGLVAGACAAGLAVLAILGPSPGDDPESAVTVPGIPTDQELFVLRQRSQSLEKTLRGLPPAPRVIRADTAGSIAELQDRIAWVDERLNRTAAADRPRAESMALWRERVALMDRLVRVRAQTIAAESF